MQKTRKAQEKKSLETTSVSTLDIKAYIFDKWQIFVKKMKPR